MFAVLLTAINSPYIHVAGSLLVGMVILQAALRLRLRGHSSKTLSPLSQLSSEPSSEEAANHVHVPSITVWSLENSVLLSGAVGSVRQDGRSVMVDGGVSEQTTQALKNLLTLVEAAMRQQSPRKARLLQRSEDSVADQPSASNRIDAHVRNHFTQLRVQLSDPSQQAYNEFRQACRAFFAGCTSVPKVVVERGKKLAVASALVEIDCAASLPVAVHASRAARISDALIRIPAAAVPASA